MSCVDYDLCEKCLNKKKKFKQNHSVDHPLRWFDSTSAIRTHSTKSSCRRISTFYIQLAINSVRVAITP
jgi:hypothetical protein